LTLDDARRSGWVLLGESAVDAKLVVAGLNLGAFLRVVVHVDGGKEECKEHKGNRRRKIGGADVLIH